MSVRRFVGAFASSLGQSMAEQARANWMMAMRQAERLQDREWRREDRQEDMAFRREEKAEDRAADQEVWEKRTKIQQDNQREMQDRSFRQQLALDAQRDARDARRQSAAFARQLALEERRERQEREREARRIANQREQQRLEQDAARRRQIAQHAIQRNTTRVAGRLEGGQEVVDWDAVNSMVFREGIDRFGNLLPPAPRSPDQWQNNGVYMAPAGPMKRVDRTFYRWDYQTNKWKRA